MSGTLILLGTPIGNLSDLSERAAETLKKADFIAAEDTRVTIKLLNHLDIKKPMISYFEHNKHQKGEYIVNRILSGETCVLVSDAGMPAISDPGEELVAQCLPALRETWVRLLGWEDPLEEGMTTHSNILAWRIPRTEEPDGLYM